MIFDLWFFSFTMVHKWYAFFRNYTLNFTVWGLTIASGEPRDCRGEQQIHLNCSSPRQPSDCSLSVWWSVQSLSHVRLWDSMVCSLPGSSVHGILQSAIPEWVVISFSRASSLPKGRTQVSCLGRQILYHWATREAFGLATVFENFSQFHQVNLEMPNWTLNSW